MFNLNISFIWANDCDTCFTLDNGPWDLKPIFVDYNIDSQSSPKLIFSIFQEMSAIKVGYWTFRGLVEPIQMYLHFKAIPFQKTAYTHENASQWLEKVKKQIGVWFPKHPIPYSRWFENLPDNHNFEVSRTKIRRILHWKFGTRHQAGLNVRKHRRYQTPLWGHVLREGQHGKEETNVLSAP